MALACVGALALVTRAEMNDRYGRKRTRTASLGLRPPGASVAHGSVSPPPEPPEPPPWPPEGRPPAWPPPEPFRDAG